MHRKNIFILSGLCLFTRLVLAFYFYGTYDIYHSSIQYQIIKHKNYLAMWNDLGNPHSPVGAWINYFVGIAHEWSHLPFSTLAKFPAILADLGITLLIYAAMLKLGRDRAGALRSGLLYALNPLAILITGLNGQFDSICIFFLLAAWYFWMFAGSRRLVLSALFLGIGVATKEFPIMLYPLFMLRLANTKERLRYTAVMLVPPVAVFILSFFFYTPLFVTWIPKYQSAHGFWGISLLLYFLKNHAGGFFIILNAVSERFGNFLLLFILLFISFRERKRLELVCAIVMIFSAFYFFANGMGTQYLLWILPFAVIKRDKFLYPYTFFASIVALMWYEPAFRYSLDIYTHSHGYNFTRNAFAMIAWLVCGFWFWKVLRQAGAVRA